MKTLDLAKQCANERLIDRSFSDRTAGNLISAIQTFVRRTKAEELEDVTREVILSFFSDGMKNLSWRPNTQLNYFKYLKNLFDWCEDRKYIKKCRNPIRTISRPKIGKILPRRLSEQEASELMNTVINCDWSYDFEKKRNPTIIGTLLFSGLRISELLNLKMEDVDLEKKNISVKNGKFRKNREVPIHRKLHIMLTDYLVARKRFNKKSEYFFCSVRGDKKLNYKDINRMVNKIRQKIPFYFSPHCLRHTFASISTESGMPLVVLQRIMGHGDIKSTMVYVEITDKSVKDWMDNLNLPY
jgi:site-specific recombinase XerD